MTHAALPSDGEFEIEIDLFDLDDSVRELFDLARRRAQEFLHGIRGN